MNGVECFNLNVTNVVSYKCTSFVEFQLNVLMKVFAVDMYLYVTYVRVLKDLVTYLDNCCKKRIEDLGMRGEDIYIQESLG